MVQFEILDPMDSIDKSYLCWTQGSVMDPRNFQMILHLYIFFYFRFLIDVNKIGNIQVLSEISEKDESFQYFNRINFSLQMSLDQHLC